MKLKDYIYPLPRYPNDGKYLKCEINLPCDIEKGFDPCVIGRFSDHKMTKRHLWYVYWDREIGIETTKGYNTLEKAVTEACNMYYDWLTEERFRVSQILDELGL